MEKVFEKNKNDYECSAKSMMNEINYAKLLNKWSCYSKESLIRVANSLFIIDFQNELLLMLAVSLFLKF